jgi:ATP-dependent DNA helicase RecQ
MGISWHREIKFYHAGLSREEKADVEKWFMAGKEAVLCATCAYGVGVDKADIRTVIHRDCAPSVEAYLQESGRVGRDGAQSRAILLWGPDDERSLARAKTEAERRRVSALLRYARDTGSCRRHALLKMLDYNADGEVPERHCCDVCEKEAGGELREEASLKDFFRRNKRRFTVDEAASILARSGAVRLSENEARQAVSCLIKTGKLKKLPQFPWKRTITLL